MQRVKGVELDPRYKGMFTPNETNKEPEETEESGKQTENENGNTNQDSE